MFATSNDFTTPPYNIPNLNDVANTFPDYVNKVEKKALLKLLGRQFYDAFVAGLAALPGEYSLTVPTVINQQYTHGNNIWKALTVTTGVAPTAGINWELVEADNKWLKLKNGAEYDYEDETWKWEGMVDLLVPKIFANYVSDNVDSFTGNSVIVPNNENSIWVSPAVRICKAINDYAEKVGVVDFDLYSLSYADSLYGFLLANAADYPEWDGEFFEVPEVINTFGL